MSAALLTEVMPLRAFASEKTELAKNDILDFDSFRNVVVTFIWQDSFANHKHIYRSTCGDLFKLIEDTNQRVVIQSSKVERGQNINPKIKGDIQPNYEDVKKVYLFYTRYRESYERELKHHRPLGPGLNENDYRNIKIAYEKAFQPLNFLPGGVEFLNDLTFGLAAKATDSMLGKQFNAILNTALFEGHSHSMYLTTDILNHIKKEAVAFIKTSEREKKIAVMDYYGSQNLAPRSNAFQPPVHWNSFGHEIICTLHRSDDCNRQEGQLHLNCDLYDISVFDRGFYAYLERLSGKVQKDVFDQLRR